MKEDKDSKYKSLLYVDLVLRIISIFGKGGRAVLATYDWKRKFLHPVVRYNKVSQNSYVAKLQCALISVDYTMHFGEAWSLFLFFNEKAFSRMRSVSDCHHAERQTPNHPPRWCPRIHRNALYESWHPLRFHKHSHTNVHECFFDADTFNKNHENIKLC